MRGEQKLFLRRFDVRVSYRAVPSHVARLTQDHFPIAHSCAVLVGRTGVDAAATAHLKMCFVLPDDAGVDLQLHGRMPDKQSTRTRAAADWTAKMD